MICIGYVGVEAFDIILYIGKSLSMLNYPVLIIDLSDTRALTKTIYHGMNLDSSDTMIHYRKLNYIRKVPEETELKEFSEGIIFIVYGFNYIESIPYHLDFLNIVVDPFPNNIDRINGILNNSSLENMNVNLLIRDIVTIDDYVRVKSSIVSARSHSRSSYLYYDIYDYENALKCQLFQSIRFTKISSGMKKLIMSQIADILPSLKHSVIRKAICIAKKGEKY